MLEYHTAVRRIVLACGTVDLRKGIDGLAIIIGDRYKQNMFEKGRKEGIELVRRLLEDGRQEEIDRTMADDAYLRKQLSEYGM